MAEKPKTYFAERKRFYPELREGNTIPTDEFITASKGIVDFLALFGTVFAPLKSDVSTNVTKLETKFVQDRAQYATLQSLVTADLKENNGKMGVATEGLLWLKRGLEYIRVFLELLIEDHISGTKSESIVGLLQGAYERTLKRHHGYFAKKLFTLMSHATPYRRDLMKNIADGTEEHEDQSIADLQVYMPPFAANVDVLVKFYIQQNLDTPHPGPQ